MSGVPAVELTVAAGDWPAEAELRVLAEAAVAAVVKAVDGESPSPLRGGGKELPRLGPSPLPDPPPPLRQAQDEGREVSILFTDDAAMRRLNAQYRGIDKATNVLSFPQPDGLLLGDIILAYGTVRDEAALAGKPLKAHMAHLIVHGFLHLLGHDHESDAEAETMEALERAALAEMGLADPYSANSGPAARQR